VEARIAIVEADDDAVRRGLRLIAERKLPVRVLLRHSVRHARDRRRIARDEIHERPSGRVLESELGVRDRVAVRVMGREAELGVDLRLQLLRECVLEQLRLRVHLVEREPEAVHQVQLEQAVVAEHLECAAPS